MYGRSVGNLKKIDCMRRNSAYRFLTTLGPLRQLLGSDVVEKLPSMCYHEAIKFSRLPCKHVGCRWIVMPLGHRSLPSRPRIYIQALSKYIFQSVCLVEIIRITKASLQISAFKFRSRKIICMYLNVASMTFNHFFQLFIKLHAHWVAIGINQY